MLSSFPGKILRTVFKLMRTAWHYGTGLIARVYLWSVGVQYGKRLQISSLPVVRRHPAASIRLGESVTIQNLLTENCAGISHRCSIVAATAKSRVTVGDHVGMSGVVIFCNEEISIGDHVNLGVGVKIYDTDFHPLDWKARRHHDVKAIESKPVKICEDVWIGADVKVMKGVTIGARSIIGSGSIVTRSIPPDSVAVGIPARVVRSLKNAYSDDAKD